MGIVKTDYIALAVEVPAIQGGHRVNRSAVDVDLEVQMAADGAGVAGLAHGADALAGPDLGTPVDRGGTGQVGVEVGAVLALTVDQQVVAVEDRVIAAAQHPPGRDGDQRRAAGGDDVEAFVTAAAAARGTEFADRPARPVRPLDREDVGVELGSSVADDLSRYGRSEDCEQDEAEEEEALQWCSMTRSTMLYSFASSAVMK